MTDLTAQQLAVVTVLTERGEYDSAYRYIADNIDPEHSSRDWFDSASHINANDLSAVAGYAAGAYFVTDLYEDTDTSTDDILELDVQQASDDIANAVLDGILETGIVPDVKEILENDAGTAIEGSGIPPVNWIGNHTIGRLYYPDLDRAGVGVTFSSIASELGGAVNAFLNVAVDIQTHGILSGLERGRIAAEIAEAEAEAARRLAQSDDDTNDTDTNDTDTNDTNDTNTDDTDTDDTDTSADLVVGDDGLIYEADNVGSGQELNGLDQIAAENETSTFTDDSGPSYYDYDVGGAQPVIFDLDGDGVEIIFGQDVYFDMDGDGFLENTGWVGDGDGFLVIDLNANGSRGAGDGIIDQTDELILANWGNDGDTDLQGLRSAFDDDNNGILNAQDDIWDELNVWVDANQDGITDAGELRTLASLGITEINLSYDDGSAFSDTTDDISVFGNTLHGLASFTRNGEVVTGGVGDVSLRYEADGWRRVETDLGCRIEIENGPTFSYAELDAGTAANVNLATEVLDGAIGDDRANILTAYGFSRSVIIDGGNGNDVVSGGHNNDTLSGGAGADVIHGRDGNDVLFIDANDLLNGAVSGGNGIDTLIVTESLGGVDIDLLALTAEAAIGGAGGDAISGAGLNDDIRISGGDGDDILIGGYASDNLSGGNGADTINGGNGGDVIFGGEGFDVLRGQAGDDMIIGGNGDDMMTGEGGDDNLYGGDRFDVLYGGEGDDDVFGGWGGDTIFGGRGDDRLHGQGGDDVLYFWRGDDQLYGGEGNDTFMLSRDPNQYGADGYWGWAQFQGGVGDDTVVLNANAEHFTLRHVGGSQYQIFRQVNANQFVVIDIQDIEHIQYADGEVVNLSSDELLDTSDTYVRSNPFVDFGDDTYTGSGLMFGWSGDDTMTGGSLGDTILGQTGSDVLDGGAGVDVLGGGSGSDTMLGGDGADTLYGGSGDDIMEGGQGNDRMFGAQGSDLMIGRAGEDVLKGQAGADLLFGGTGHDELYGGDDQDRIYGGDGADTISGDNGADLLDGGQGGDRILGNAGADEIYGGSSNDSAFGGAGFDIVYGGSGDDYLNGGEDDDILLGGIGNDTLVGGTGRDILVGGAGADILDGGAGVLDSVNYEGSEDTGGIVIDLDANDAMGGDAAGDSFINIENITASQFNDTVRGDSSDNIIEGLDGDDYLVGRDGHDILVGGGGNDELFGGAGHDRFIGGTGRDTVNYTHESSAAIVDLRDFENNAGAAEGDAHIEIERIIGTDYDDRLFGMSGVETLNGGAGNDIIFGRAGDDLLNGGGGNDTISGGDGGDIINGNGGYDTASYALSTSGITFNQVNIGQNTGDAAGDVLTDIEHVIATDYRDILRGDNASNQFSGLEGNDIIFGGGGDDMLDGGANEDILVGGRGNDTLTGGNGIDQFRFNASLNVGADTITDFENGADHIYLQNASFSDVTITANGQNTVVSWANGSVELLDISSGAITTDNFIFV